MGTLGAGNHYAEIQVIDKVFDDAAARKMGIDQEGQVGHLRRLASCSLQGFSPLLLCLPHLHLHKTHLDSAALCVPISVPGHRCYFSILLIDSNCFTGGESLQVCIMIHSGSRGLGHQVATDALTSMERAMARDNIQTNDRQLACARINSQVLGASAS